MGGTCSTCGRDERCIHVSVGKPDGKVSLGRPRRIWEDNKNMDEAFYYQLMHIMLKNTELLKHSKIMLQHVSIYIETIFRELKSVLG